MLTGSLGMLPSASISEPGKPGIYEPVSSLFCFECACCCSWARVWLGGLPPSASTSLVSPATKARHLRADELTVLPRSLCLSVVGPTVLLLSALTAFVHGGGCGGASFRLRARRCRPGKSTDIPSSTRTTCSAKTHLFSFSLSPSVSLQVHGSAPDIAGQDKANPLAMVLSAAMMCRYGLNLPKARRCGHGLMGGQGAEADGLGARRGLPRCSCCPVHCSFALPTPPTGSSLAFTAPHAWQQGRAAVHGMLPGVLSAQLPNCAPTFCSLLHLLLSCRWPTAWRAR